jgi:hypothetical protein
LVTITGDGQERLEDLLASHRGSSAEATELQANIRRAGRNVHLTPLMILGQLALDMLLQLCPFASWDSGTTSVLKKESLSEFSAGHV